MQKSKTQKGITLIALVITIIVMLILVGVTVTVSLNGGLFTTAKQATSETQIAKESEELLMAAMGALGENGEVLLSKLDNSLPQGFQKTAEGTYKSPTGNIFTVGTNGKITLVGSSTEEEPETPVTPPATPTITLSTTQINKEITNGTPETVELTATLNNASGDLTWQTSDASIAEISGSGTTRTITLKKAGTATITVKYGTQASATCSVTVTEKTVEMATVTITVDADTSDCGCGFFSKSTDVITYESISSTSAYTVDLPVGSTLYVWTFDGGHGAVKMFGWSYPMSHSTFMGGLINTALSLQNFPLLAFYNGFPCYEVNGVTTERLWNS